jgi:hypothetical protein
MQNATKQEATKGVGADTFAAVRSIVRAATLVSALLIAACPPHDDEPEPDGSSQGDGAGQGDDAALDDAHVEEEGAGSADADVSDADTGVDGSTGSSDASGSEPEAGVLDAAGEEASVLDAGEMDSQQPGVDAMVEDANPPLDAADAGDANAVTEDATTDAASIDAQEASSPETGSGDGSAPEISCTDNKKNGDETDRDCGGTCPDKCPSSYACKVSADCQSNICSIAKCRSPLPPVVSNCVGQPDGTYCSGSGSSCERYQCFSSICSRTARNVGCLEGGPGNECSNGTCNAYSVYECNPKPAGTSCYRYGSPPGQGTCSETGSCDVNP